MPYGDHAKQKKSGLPRSIFNLIIVIVMVAALSFVMRTYVFAAYMIPSGSMQETIQIKDMVFSEKVTYYSRSPQRGDIITFEDPEMPNRILIKRVIATEGETVTLVDGKVCVDGKALSEPYTRGLPSSPLSSPVTYPYTVPQGCVWVMGDNRTNSSDSRFFGAVEVSSITGKAILVYWPLQHFGMLE